MKYFLLAAVVLLLQPFTAPFACAQADSSQQLLKDSTTLNPADEASVEDDEFNVFILVVGTTVVCAMIGAAIVGAFAAALFLLLLVALAALGIVSASVLVGLYKRSFQSGFKSFIVILSVMVCTALGAGGAWLINHIFKLNITDTTSLLCGGAGGFIGGFIIALAVIKIIQSILSAFKKRMHISG